MAHTMDMRNRITGINQILKTELHSYFAQDLNEPYCTLAQEILVPLYETISDTYNFFQYLKNPRSYFDVVIAFSEAWFEKINEIFSIINAFLIMNYFFCVINFMICCSILI